MRYGGVDGCKYGWVLIKCIDGEFEYGGVFNCIKDLIDTNEDLDRILIDIPIGLSSKRRIRTIDSEMKKELKERHSTVFNAPSRETLVAKSHKEASSINKEVEGKGISIQTFYISKKIGELDSLFELDKSVRSKFIESHPEIAFKYLNKGRIVLSKKSSSEGIQERLEILSKIDSEIMCFYSKIVTETRRKYVSKDDIIDAICLCLINKLSGKNKMSFIYDPLIADENGIQMRIGYYQH